MVAERLSPSLASLLQPLALLAGDTQSPLATLILQPARQPFDEQTIRYRLADHAVRVWAAAALEREGKPFAAAALRALAPVVDAERATAAAAAVRSNSGIEAAAIAAERAPLSAEQPAGAGFVGEQVAYAVLALAERFASTADKQRILDEALALVTELQTGKAGAPHGPG